MVYAVAAWCGRGVARPTPEPGNEIAGMDTVGKLGGALLACDRGAKKKEKSLHYFRSIYTLV